MAEATRRALPGHREVGGGTGRKIEASKQYIASEAKRTNDTLVAFQHKFTQELSSTKDGLQNNIDNLSKQTKENFE